MRCPYKRVRSAHQTRHFMVGERLDEMLRLRLCDEDTQLFDREFNVWFRAADVAPPGTTACMRCPPRPRVAATHTRYLMVGEDSDEACHIRLCESHMREFDRDIGAWVPLADVVELDPARARALRRGASEYGDEAARQIRELRERAAARRPRANSSAAGEVQPSSVFDEWRFSVHAQERAEERNFTRQQVLLAAISPTTTAPTTGKDAGPDKFYHSRAGVTVVVNRRERIIITVYRQSEYDNKIARSPRRPSLPTWKGTV